MRRIYFLVPNAKTTRNIVAELHSEGIEDKNIHILAKRDTPMRGMPEASVFEKTDLIPAVERGAVLGAITGLVAALIGLPLSGFEIEIEMVLGIMFFGGVVGTISSGLAGLQMGNSRVKQYENAIEKGGMLIMVDIAKERIDEIHEVIVKHYPNAVFEGVEPPIF